MVTLEDIRVKRAELEAAKKENEQAANEPIPQRRFGIKGVTKQQQQAAIERKRLAQDNLFKIYEGERTLNDAEGSINRYQNEVAAYNSEKEAVRRANKALARQRLGLNPFQGGLKGRALELFRNANSERITEPTAPNEGVVNVEGIGGFSVAPEKQEAFAEKYANQGYTVTTPTMKITPLNQGDTIDLPDGSYSVAQSKQGTFLINKSMRDYENEQLGYTKARLAGKPNKFYGSSLAGDNPVIRKENIGYDLSVGGIKTLARGFEYALPKSAYEQGTKRELAFERKMPTIYGFSRKAADFTADSLGMGIIGAPFMSNRVASINFIEPEFRVKPLSAKQAPRSVGFDVVDMGNNKFMFGENIKIPKRFQTVNTQVKDYFGYKPYRKIYSPEVILQQKTIAPVNINLDGDIVGAAPVRVQQVKPYKNSYTFSNLRGGARIKDFDKYSPEQQRLFNDLFRTTGQQGKAGRFSYLKGNQDLFVASIENVKLTKASINPARKEIYLKFIKSGKRITRSDILGVQSKLAETPDRELYSYVFKSLDTTMPTSKARTRALTRGFSVAQKPIEPGTDAGYTMVSKRMWINKPVIQKAFQDLGLKEAASFKVTPVKLSKTSTSSGGKAFFNPGSGLPNQAQMDKQINKQFSLPRSSQKEFAKEMTISKELTRLSQSPATMIRQNEIVRPMTRSMNRELQLPRFNQVERVQQRQQQRLQQRQTQRLTQITRFGFGRGITTPSPRLPRKPKPGRPIPFGFGLPSFGGKSSGTRSQGFFTEIKRFGRFFRLPGVRTRGGALRYGEQTVNRSLAATFRVKKAPRTILGKPTSYRPSSGIYRAFKVQRGRRIPLLNTYIQKRGQRLNFYPERVAIQRARQSKSKKKKGWLDF